MTLLAGFGTAVITPPLPVALAGFIEPQPATEVHDDLEVRAVFLSGDGVAVCLLVCDLLGMSSGYADPVRDAVGAALGLERAAVLTSCIHTHAAPSAMDGTAALGWDNPEGYRELLAERCTAAAIAARQDADRATLHHTRQPLPAGLSINRRGHPYDPWLSALDVRRTDGTRAGTIANVAIHPVALGPECLAVSSDWVGPFRGALAATAGGTPVLLSGALGDVNPRHVHRQENDCAADGFAEAAELGTEVAQAVDAALGETEAVPSTGPQVERHRVIEVPIGGTMLAGRRSGRTLRVELVEWSLGPIRLVSVPGEAFHQLGREIEERWGHRVLLAGLAPVWHGYLPVPFTDGYEESMSYGAEAVAAIAGALTEFDG